MYPNQFVTKTCLTTFTFLTTFVENGTTAVSSREQVISNIATEERNTGKVTPTPSMGITLTQVRMKEPINHIYSDVNLFQYPNLSVGIFPTTYTYFNTIMDGEQPLVVQSKHTVRNTVTAPDDYLSLLHPSEKASAVRDTNTYYSTVTLEKTLVEGDETKVVNTEEVVTQVVITESVPPKATSVMTSYIALDVEDPNPSQNDITTTDVIKTYYITYTYHDTLTKNGHTYVQTNISTSTDVVTEKLYLHPKKTSAPAKIISTAPISGENEFNEFEILATKTYLTTFTSRTTMLSEKPDGSEETVVSSRFRIVENVMTETVDPTLLEKKYLNSVRKEIRGVEPLTKIATINGLQMEVVFIPKETIKPTSVLPIEKTKMPELIGTIQPSTPNIITGSTIVFVDEDDDPFKLAASEPTPVIVSSKVAKTTTLKNNLNSLLSSEIVNKPSKNSKRHTNKETIISSKPSTSTTTSKVHRDPPKKKPVNNKVTRPANPVSDLLGLGSININRLTPVLNVMADLLQNNLKKPKKNDTISTTTHKPTARIPENIRPKAPMKPPQLVDNQNRPIYIPVGGFTDIEVAESQNIATFQINEQVPWSDAKHEALIGKLTHESPLLNGGIPISPGEIITANSDVIVGKPGRVGPRIPAIPLHDVENDEELSTVMKPPPLVQQNDNIKRPYEKKPIPIRHEAPTRPIMHVPNKDDYVGPPPLPEVQVSNENKQKTEDYVVLLPPHPNNYDNLYNVPIITIPDTLPNESPQIHNQYSHPPVVLGTPINEFNIQPSIMNEPIVLPEVIERSTGQPLLVNIQPSQVAFVNIPHNRTTALIYGGSTEPHRNGQYFDDPSPYPEAEFSIGGNNYNSAVPSIYNQNQYNGEDHKQVGGIIKVDARPIIVNTPGVHQTSAPETISIKPSKPMSASIEVQNVKIDAPPISFGSVQKDNDFDGYIIRHHDSNFDNKRPNLANTALVPPNPGHRQEQYNSNTNVHNNNNNLISFPNSFTGLNTTTNKIPKENFGGYTGNYFNDNSQKIKPVVHVDESMLPNRFNLPKESPHSNVRLPNYRKPHPRPRPNYPNRLQPPNRLKPEVADYMTPPPVQVTELFQNPSVQNAYNIHTLKPVSHRPQTPLIHTPISSGTLNKRPTDNNANKINELYHNNNVKNYQTFDGFVDASVDLDDMDDYDHDGEMNEAGEVVQESNTRPLRPGQIPIEIQRVKNLTATTQRPSLFKFTTSVSNNVKPQIHFNNRTVNYNTSIKIGSSIENEIPHQPIIQKPRPFSITEVRPQSQQNQIVSYKHDKLDHSRYNTSNTRANSSTVTTESNRIQVILSRPSNTNIPSESQKVRPQFTTKSPHKVIKGTASQQDVRIPAIDGNVNENKIISNKIERPKVTSLPIDVQSTRKPMTSLSPSVFNSNNVGTQTEKPFREALPKQDQATPNPLSNFDNRDVVDVTKPQRVTTPKSNTTPPKKINLNIGELPPKYFVNKSVAPISDMEIMKPPPPVFVNYSLKKPSTEMQPPNLGKVEVFKVPNKLSVQHPVFKHDRPISTSVPYVPKPSEEMKPPPITTEIVIGMSPPAVTTHRPSYRPKIPTSKPSVYSLELDPPRTTSTYPSTLRQPTRTRRPYPRRPVVYRPTTETPTRTTTARLENLVTSPKSHRIAHRPTTTGKPIRNTVKDFKPNLTQNINTNTINVSHGTYAPKTTTTQKLAVDIITKPATQTPARNSTFDMKTNVINKSNNEIRNSSKDIVSDSSNKITNHYENESIKKIANPIEHHSNREESKVPVYLSNSRKEIQPTPTISKDIETEADVDIITKGSGTDMHVFFNIGNTKDVDFKIEPSIVPVETTAQAPTQFLDRTPVVSINQKTTTPINTTPTIIKNRFGQGNTVKEAQKEHKNEIQNSRINTNFRKPNRTVINNIISINPVSTKYITYTTTSTFTLTKTSIITASGEPASTYTTVITKTEKYTLVDTITEVTTLWQPTNVVETVTTTINHFPHTLYGSGANYGNIRPTIISPSVETTRLPEDDLIITETDPPVRNEVDPDNDSILVVLTDKNNGGIIHKDDKETQVIDEVIENNEAGKILLGGISIASLPSFESPILNNGERCNPECRASKNELCQKHEGVMKCICRPGFARMFPDHPCKRKLDVNGGLFELSGFILQLLIHTP